MDKVKYYIFPFILGLVATFLSLNKIDQDLYKDLNPTVLYFILILTAGVMLLIFNNNVSSKSHSLIKTTWIYFVIAIIGAFEDLSDPSMIANAFFVVFFVPYAFYLGLKVNSLENDSRRCNYNIILLCLMLPAYVCSFIYLNMYDLAQELFGRDFVFPIVIVSTLLLFFKSSILKFGSLGLFLPVVFMCAKRSGIIVIVIVLVVALIQEFQKKGYKNKTKALVLLALFIYIGYKFYLINIDQMDYVSDRFFSEDADSSGRDEIYSKVWSFLKNKEIVSLIIGNGYLSLNDILGCPAHNDLLQIVCDFGIIAAITYFIILLKYVKKAFKICRTNALMLVAIINFLVIGMLNSVSCTPIYVFMSFMVLGYVFEHSQNNVNNK